MLCVGWLVGGQWEWVGRVMSEGDGPETEGDDVLFGGVYQAVSSLDEGPYSRAWTRRR